jgi:outer membrane lipoprotein-sorting protein
MKRGIVALALLLAAKAIAQPSADGAVRAKAQRARDAGAPTQGSPVADAGAAARGDAASSQGARDGGAFSPTLASVLAELASIGALSARFREEKQMALLAQPLVSEGSLHYEKPRRLAHQVEKPRKQSMVLEGDVLSFGDAQKSESVGLATQPALRMLVETFVSVLGGDRAALERVADVQLVPLAGAYRIVVKPRDAALRKLVQSMSFEGQGAILSKMELVDATGDRTVTTFRDVTVRAPFSASERKRLFRVGG